MATRRSRLLRGAAVTGFWLLILIGAVLLGAALWVQRTFGAISVDQLLMNLPGGEGAGGDEVVTSAVVSILLIPTGVVLVLALLTERSRRVLRRSGGLRARRSRALRGIAAVVAVAVPVSGAVAFGSTIGVGAYVQSYAREAAGEATIADYYVVPRHGVSANAVGGPGMRADGASQTEHRNLIVIYLESVENAMADDELFEKNMLEPVERATEGWESIPSLHTYDGGGWTMAGIVGTQCGIPLRTDNTFNDNFDLNKLGSEGYEITSYLPGATCLGDVLAREGYRNVFMGGADANFAGKGSFLSTHGYDEIHDLQEWRAAGETEIREDWGLSDRRLFELAREQVVRLHEQQQPFNLTMLTLDTHEYPYLYDSCVQDTEAPLTSITFCSMEQVAGFVDALGELGILEDTSVVLMGDHRKQVAEGSSFWNELGAREDRSLFTRVWSPDGARFERGRLDQLSMYPTLLELAGIELEDHRAGAGVSALVGARDVPEGTILDLDAGEYSAVVQSRAAGFYRELWSERTP